jgi:hypothetical protein
MHPDPLLNLMPNEKPQTAQVHRVLTNAFGFGGNNAALVFGDLAGKESPHVTDLNRRATPFFVHGRACLSAAGDTAETLARLRAGGHVRGIVPAGDILKPLSEKAVRRLKRLPRMVLSLAVSACGHPSGCESPQAVFFGTGWGSLSETHDFLHKLFTSGERFNSPTDFIGSVHNAPAGQAAIDFQATGPNITMTGGECTFAQALLCADLLGQDEPLLLVGADEYHEALSPLFDASVILEGPPADGGGALYLKRQRSGATCQVTPAFMAYAGTGDPPLPEMVASLGGTARIRKRFGLVLAGIQAAQRDQGENQLDAFLSLTGFSHPVVDYRRFLGEFASASAVATVLAVRMVEAGEIPGAFCGHDSHSLAGRGVLVLGFGDHMTALEVGPC